MFKLQKDLWAILKEQLQSCSLAFSYILNGRPRGAHSYTCLSYLLLGIANKVIIKLKGLLQQTRQQPWLDDLGNILQKAGLRIQTVEADGNCFFRSCCDQMQVQHSRHCADGKEAERVTDKLHYSWSCFCILSIRPQLERLCFANPLSSLQKFWKKAH